MSRAESEGALRAVVLRHVAAINAYGPGCGARCPTGELIRDAERCAELGLMIWRDDVPFPGRFLTDAGRRALAEAQARDEGGERP